MEELIMNNILDAFIEYCDNMKTFSAQLVKKSLHFCKNR